MTWWEAALLGLVQGVTEFLPISSSGHLVLAQHLLGIHSGGDVTFEVFLHFGTVLSILTVYRQPVANMIVSVSGAMRDPANLRASYRDDDAFRTAVLILVTMIPTGLAYFLFGRQLEATFAMPRLAAVMLVITGVLLVFTVLRKNPDGEITALKAFVIGVAQSAALIPGISRSGATICTALYQNVEAERAANFSFLMLLPVVLGATLIKGVELFEVGVQSDWSLILIGSVIAYLSGIVAIRVLLGVIRRGRLQYFAIYCFVVGVTGYVLLG